MTSFVLIDFSHIVFRYNDVPLVYDKAIYEQLRAADIDHLLAEHIAHLFIRDTVSLFSEKVDQDDTIDTDHFEVRCNQIYLVFDNKFKV